MKTRVKNLLLLFLLVGLPAFAAQAGVVLTTLHSFNVFPNGANPLAGLVQGSDGDFYGTTTSGGTNGGYGTVFKISTNGVATSLYSFTGGNDGSRPEGGLVQGSDGDFYGTTFYGGTRGYGTVFKISTNGVLTNLYSFIGTSDGANPTAGLVQGRDGDFYGMTYGYPDGYEGTVFKISTNGVLTPLYAFSNRTGSESGLVQGSDGNFYGTTEGGGTNSDGTVFEINTFGTLTILHSFTDGNDGGYPYAGLVQGGDGNFYGTTGEGGTYSYGTVFKINANGALTTLYSFTGGNDGADPEAALVQASDGNFYGTTFSDGTNGFGTVFKISTNGVLTSLYSFNFPLDFLDDFEHSAALMQGSDGNLYGTTYQGGTQGYYSDGAYMSYGTVFKISTNGVLTTLYSFPGGNDGAVPEAALVQGSDGNFYGTTSGDAPDGGFDNSGTVFKISTNDVLTTLYAFGSLGFTGFGSSLDGAIPKTGLVQGSDGNFYGTTSSGGANAVVAYGTVFKISTNGVLTTLYSFTGNTDGSSPSALVQGNDGNFYDTTYQGGTTYHGNVFEINTNGALTNLYSFTGNTDGAIPGGLMQDGDGNLYGVTGRGGNLNVNSGEGAGTVFKITATGLLTTLYAFGTVTNANGYPVDGMDPTAPLVQGSDGNFYGTTYQGGMIGYGTVFKISDNGALTTLYSFTGGNDGAYPVAGLVQGSDGNFYGTTFSGGTNGFGTVFEISTNGALTTLYSFTGGNDGASPYAGLVRGSDGNFYGTTQIGGEGAAGTVFRLTIVSEPPELTITPSGANVILTWPTATGFILQSTTNLAPPAIWSTVFPAPVIVSGQNTVTNSVSGKQMFYRLSP